MNVFARFDEIRSRTLQDMKEICTNKSHLELKGEIILIELAPSPYSLIINVVCMIMFARFDEIPSMTLQDVKEICTNKSH